MIATIVCPPSLARRLAFCTSVIVETDHVG